MALSLSHVAAAAAAAATISTRRNTDRDQSLRPHKVPVSFRNASHDEFLSRRNVAFGLAGAILGLTVTGSGGDQSAMAAARRPPPPPPTEKKDPNVSGVMAKVLASKKRKEAMKEAMSKLREKGKVIDVPQEKES